MKAPVSEQVIEIAGDVFGISAREINANANPESIEAWDSTRHLNFILALEEKFQLQLSPEEIDGIRTVGNAIELVEGKLRAAGS